MLGEVLSRGLIPGVLLQEIDQHSVCVSAQKKR